MSSYALFAKDCNAYYFSEANSDYFCPCCDSYIGKEKYYPSQLQIVNFKKDICFTYDGQMLLSKNAKELFERISVTQLSFKRVNDSPNIFVLLTESIVAFDTQRRNTRFEDKCDCCGNYESIIGSTPPFLKNSSAINPTGIYITDIKFGSGKEKSPLYIVGSELAKKLKKAFKEIDLEQVRD